MLELKNISYQYHKKADVPPLFEDLSVKFQGATMTSIIGPNGAGKSTLLKVIADILQPAQGSVLLNNRPLREYPATEKAKSIAYLPQRTDIQFDISVKDTVLLGRAAHRRAFQAYSEKDLNMAMQSLEAVDMQNFSERSINTLSGGEYQRVMIARMLCSEADIFLFDEPISSLDIHHCFSVMQLLQSLAKQGKTIIIALHQLDLAFRFCEYTLCLGPSQNSSWIYDKTEATMSRENLARFFSIESEISKGHLIFTRALH